MLHNRKEIEATENNRVIGKPAEIPLIIACSRENHDLFSVVPFHRRIQVDPLKPLACFGDRSE